MSERANEWAQRSAQANRAVRRERMSEQCERTSERGSEWPSTLRVDFIVILPTVRSHIHLLSTPWLVRALFFTYLLAHYFVAHSTACLVVLISLVYPAALTCLLVHSLIPEFVESIGSFLKRFSINVKKKWKKKWRWPSRKMKHWYKYNINIVFIFA